MRTLEKILRLESAMDVEQLDNMAKAFGVSPETLVATARSNAEVYLPDGTLNPAHTRGETPSAASIARARSRRRPDSAG